MNITSKLEDYLEAVFVLQGKDHRPVRIKQIADFLNVNKATVVSAVKKLKESKLLEQEHYGYIFLTEEGEKQAKIIYGNHSTLKRFLMTVVKLSEEQAEEEACEMEHILSKETIKRFDALTKASLNNEPFPEF